MPRVKEMETRNIIGHADNPMKLKRMASYGLKTGQNAMRCRGKIDVISSYTLWGCDVMFLFGKLCNISGLTFLLTG
ncbi:hypothetical protein HanPSC8_Chr05g0217551 [Helianthus annuus]|nr:hypothetical protein HanPSC8_Chr05g0217551 [Helianthus annuus]